jgi:hypothetical protein
VFSTFHTIFNIRFPGLVSDFQVFLSIFSDETAKDNVDDGVEKSTSENGHEDIQTEIKSDNKELLENEE